MREYSDDELTGLLQQGLRQMPEPQLSAGFDAGVRAELRRRAQPWPSFMASFRLTLAPAACALAVTLAALIVSARPGTESAARTVPHAAGSLALERASRRTRDLDETLDRIDRETPSLAGFSTAPAETPRHEEAPPGAGRHGASGWRGAALGKIRA